MLVSNCPLLFGTLARGCHRLPGRHQMPRRAALWRVEALRLVVTLAGLAVMLHAPPARAQVSARDGYAPDGSYRVQVEVTPYAWLPATNTNFTLGPRGGVNGTASSGVPTAAQLANSLHGAFMAYGLL